MDVLRVTLFVRLVRLRLSKFLDTTPVTQVPQSPFILLTQLQVFITIRVVYHLLYPCELFIIDLLPAVLRRVVNRFSTVD